MDEMQEACESCKPRMALTRRSLLTAAGAAAGLATIPGVRMSFAGTPGQSSKTLIAIFQRGAADGMSLVAPIGDPYYAKLRPSIAVPAKTAIKLDGMFGLHPEMASLAPYFSNGSLGIVHAVGDTGNTRSHFEMQDAVERMAEVNAPPSPGWINHWLTTRKGGPGAFPAVSVGGVVPTSLQGDAPAIAFPSVDSFNIDVPDTQLALIERVLLRMNAHARSDLKEPADLAISTIDKLAPYRGKTYQPSNGAVYPTGSSLGFVLSQIALLLHAKVGLSAVALDCYGWDTHVGMGPASGGTMASLAKDLSDCLAAFAKDLGSGLKDVSLLTTTEFGRTAAENGSGGTDHGMGGAMLLMGSLPSAYKGGKVHAQWPGLEAAYKDPSVDLAVTTDYKTVFTAMANQVG